MLPGGLWREPEAKRGEASTHPGSWITSSSPIASWSGASRSHTVILFTFVVASVLFWPSIHKPRDSTGFCVRSDFVWCWWWHVARWTICVEVREYVHCSGLRSSPMPRIAFHYATKLTRLSWVYIFHFLLSCHTSGNQCSSKWLRQWGFHFFPWETNVQSNRLFGNCFWYSAYIFFSLIASHYYNLNNLSFSCIPPRFLSRSISIWPSFIN